MNKGLKTALVTLAAVLAWSSSAYAGCNNPQFGGIWDLQFSDGNSCRLLVDRDGGVIAEESVCYDPFVGATAPDSGVLTVGEDCSIAGNIVVQGLTVELEAQIGTTRGIAAGRFIVPAYWIKGAITMIRVQ